MGRLLIVDFIVLGLLALGLTILPQTGTITVVLVVLAIIVWIIGTLLYLAPMLIDRSMNKVVIPPPYSTSKEAQTLHDSLFVVDLHADPLLWNRDLLAHNKHGHIDLPRLQAGNIGLQVFGVVTKTPKGQNFESNPSDTFDNITLLSVLGGWPAETRTSLLHRALYLSFKFSRFCQKSGRALIPILSVADLDALVARRKSGEKVIGGLPSLEGVHALEGKLENLDILYDAGFRMIGLTHFFDNEAGGSAHGTVKGGLTAFGKDVVRKVQQKHMTLDLAHASPRMIDDVLEISSAPFFVSHTGVKGTCNNVRNLSDEHVKRIAATGSVMGMAMFDTAVGGNTIEDTARAMRYTADLVGVDYVGLGTDYDGTVTSPVDASGMALLTEALLKMGFTQTEIQKIMGENALRVLRATLPQ